LASVFRVEYCAKKASRAYLGFLLGREDRDMFTMLHGIITQKIDFPIFIIIRACMLLSYIRLKSSGN
jgi:hypothetical protein